MYQNVTGLPTKTKGISECLLTKNNILIKTKSSSEILTSELGVCQLNVYINDGSPLTSIKKSGGGLLSVSETLLRNEGVPYSSVESITLTTNQLSHQLV